MANQKKQSVLMERPKRTQESLSYQNRQILADAVHSAESTWDTAVLFARQVMIIREDVEGRENVSSLNELGKYIKELRKKNNLTRRDVATQARVSYDQVNRLEKALLPESDAEQVALTIAPTLGVSVQDIRVVLDQLLSPIPTVASSVGL